MQVRLDIRDTATPDLERRMGRLRNLRPVLLAMGQAVTSAARRAFSQPGLRAGTWPARKKDYPHGILRKSGDLMRSIHTGSPSTHSVRVGSPKIYAAVHQFGSRKQSGRGSGIPARPFFPFVGSPESARMLPRVETAVLAAARRQVDDALA